MSATSSSLIVPTDPQLASVIIANMLENWLDSSPHAWTTPEVTDEPENLRTAEEQTGLHLCASVDPCASAPPSGEYRASVCAAAESSRTGLERTVDPDPRSGFGNIRCSYDGAHGLQNPGSGCFHGTGGGGVCLGGFATGALECRLAPAPGVVCADAHPRDRRGWLLRSGGLQRWFIVGTQGHDGASGVALHPRAPPGRQTQQSAKRRIAISTPRGIVPRRGWSYRP